MGWPTTQSGALLVGRDGSLWVGTRNGVNRFHGGRITKIAGPWDSKLQPVSSLAEDRHGNVWVGTTGGLVRISGGRVAVHSETEGLSGRACSRSTRIVRAASGSVPKPTGSTSCAMSRSPRWGKREGLSHELLLPIFEDRAGALWMGSYGGGLMSLEKGRVRTYGVADGLLASS